MDEIDEVLELERFIIEGLIARDAGNREALSALAIAIAKVFYTANLASNEDQKQKAIDSVGNAMRRAFVSFEKSTILH